MFTPVCVSHLVPVNCGKHRQENVFPLVMQIPLFKQGTGLHTFVWQVTPVNPVVHTHWNDVDPTETHIPEFMHGEDAHGLTTLGVVIVVEVEVVVCKEPHVGPLKPTGHKHCEEHVSVLREHCPPFKHGFGLQRLLTKIFKEMRQKKCYFQ